MADDLTTVLVSMFGDDEQVTVEPKTKQVSLLTGKKVFAYTMRDGVVMKLPAAVIEKLAADGYAEPLVMGKRVMREWCIVHHDAPERFRDDLELLRQAMAFARGGES